MDFFVIVLCISLHVQILFVYLYSPSAYSWHSCILSLSRLEREHILLFILLALVHVYVKHIGVGVYVCIFFLSLSSLFHFGSIPLLRPLLFRFSAFKNFLERIFIWSVVYFPFVLRYAFCSICVESPVCCLLLRYCAMAVLYVVMLYIIFFRFLFCSTHSVPSFSQFQ